MVKLGAKHITLGKRLRKFRNGIATAAELETTYPDIEPLIRRGYVRVENDRGVAIYVLTAAGLAWSDTLS